MEKSNFAIWLAVNEDGDAAVSLENAADARDSLVNDYGGASIRTVEIQVAMVLPVVREVEIDLSDDADEVDAKAA
jgi:hypothetical protein